MVKLKKIHFYDTNSRNFVLLYYNNGYQIFVYQLLNGFIFNEF